MFSMMHAEMYSVLPASIQ